MPTQQMMLSNSTNQHSMLSSNPVTAAQALNFTHKQRQISQSPNLVSG